MSRRRGEFERFLRRKATRELIKRVGALKLASASAVAFAVLLFALIVIASAGVGAAASKSDGAVKCTALGDGKKSPPAKLVPIYGEAAVHYGLGARGPSILAAINDVESGFGTNMGPSEAGALGWMQFLPSSWEAFGVDANDDGAKDPYDPEDAIFAAARLLRASRAPGHWYQAIFSYNHADWYVQEVEELAAEFSGPVVCTATAGQPVGGNALLQSVETPRQPRAFKAIPPDLWVGGGSPEPVDSRIWPDVVWVLSTFHLRVSAAREIGHNTHGDGTAVDLVPASGEGWDETARAAAEVLGWRESCGYSGSAPVCPLVPAIQFIGYNGYPDHGDPAHAGENAHLHISWQSSSFGSAELSPPPEWVRVFPLSG